MQASTPGRPRFDEIYLSRCLLKSFWKGTTSIRLTFLGGHTAGSWRNISFAASGFEEACKRAEIVYSATKAGEIIWHDLRRTFAAPLQVAILVASVNNWTHENRAGSESPFQV